MEYSRFLQVDHVLDSEGIEALYGYLRHGECLKLNDVVGVDIMTPDSILEPSVLSSSHSSGCGITNAVVSNLIALASTATTTIETGQGEEQVVVPRKKRTPKIALNRVDPVSSNGSGGSGECCRKNVNRRKRTPQRSALA